MAYPIPTYAKQRESFEDAVRLLLDAEPGFQTERFLINIYNGIDRPSDEVLVEFSGKIDADTLRQLKAVLLAPYDDERLDAIAREYPDTLYLKDS